VLGTIGDVCAIGQVLSMVVDDRLNRDDTRPDAVREGSITINLPLIDARWVAGQKVAIFPVEE